MAAASPRNHFDVFDLPVSYEIDVTALAERYRELQRVVHPDRFANASERERREAVQRAADINEAFQTLKSPLQRARYLLQLKGVQFDDQKDTNFDAEFLMEQIELREALAEVKNDPNALGRLNTLMMDINARITAMQMEVAKVLSSDDLEQAKTLVHKLQFLHKLRIESENLEAELADVL
ncbi:MAG: Fe-S protein assembly co-chaperone HscB [Gammaproteobacteria bacterium]|nr:Fe-S protein assembly co-chaperone HscB [Gammaproteobacteria bacterium]